MTVKVIDGKRYDTDKAKLIAEINDSLVIDYLRGVPLDLLYRTNRGNWFLYFKKRIDNANRSYGEDIKPLTPEEACEWLTKHNKADALEEYFPDSIEDA